MNLVTIICHPSDIALKLDLVYTVYFNAYVAIRVNKKGTYVLFYRIYSPTLKGQQLICYAILYFYRKKGLHMTGQNLNYSGGYSNHTLSQFSTRTIAREGAFLLPYLRDDMSILDCGCGPGSLSLDLAKRLQKTGNIIGMDIQAGQLAAAQEQAEQCGLDNVQFLQGSVFSLPFPEQYFDCVLAHAVLYHIPNPEKALQEISRVLKPEGIVALRDADMYADIIYPRNSTLDAAWNLIYQVFALNGANIVFGREQKGQLLAQGFSPLSLSASFDMFTSAQEVSDYARFWIDFMGSLHKNLILEHQLASENELNIFMQAFTDWAARPEAYCARARCEAVAVKA